MTILELLDELNARDIKMSVLPDDVLLRLNAPVGALTPELKTELALHKSKLLLIARTDPPDFHVIWRDIALPNGEKDKEPTFECSKCQGRKFWGLKDADVLPACALCRPFTGNNEACIYWIEG